MTTINALDYHQKAGLLSLANEAAKKYLEKCSCGDHVDHFILEDSRFYFVSEDEYGNILSKRQWSFNDVLIFIGAYAEEILGGK